MSEDKEYMTVAHSPAAGGTAYSAACGRLFSLGRGLGLSLPRGAGRAPAVAVGQGGEPTGDMLTSALAAGLYSTGADVLPLGTVPSPAVSFLVTRYKAAAGVWVGGQEDADPILFDEAGVRCCGVPEAEPAADTPSYLPGRLLPRRLAAEDYVSHLLAQSEVSLLGMRLVVDCAGGTAAMTARRLFTSLEAECVFLGEPAPPEDCRQTESYRRGNVKHDSVESIEQLAELTTRLKYFGGVSFSPDGSRCVMVDEQGNRLDSERLLAALAYDKKEKGCLPGCRVAVESGVNGGLLRFLKEQGIAYDLVEGSGRLWEALHLSGAVLAGDGRGRVLDASCSRLFDGQLAALQVLTLCRERGWKLSRVSSLMERLPEVTVSVRADAEARGRFRADETLRGVIAEANRALGGEGRIRAEASRTEPLIFVMAEGRDFDELNRLAVRLAKEIAVAVGAPEQEPVQRVSEGETGAGR